MGAAVDLDRCTGCKHAAMSHRKWHSNGGTAGLAKGGTSRIGSSSITGLSRCSREVQTGNVPTVRRRSVRTGLPNTPTITERALNAQVYNRCIGTLRANACPYNVRFFNFGNPVWQRPLELSLNPDVSVQEVGVVEKCTFCVRRITE
jgi:molybdopterin-containing oxidoreductase family iron-sulfur binding subunit